MKVKNMQSSKGNDVPNQFIITDVQYMGLFGTMFQSYNSSIAFKPYGKDIIILDEHYWDYSTTTGKYRNMFLGETKKETEKKIASGEYKLANLN